MKIRSFLTISILLLALQAHALRRANVYFVGNALKAQVRPVRQLTLADFRRASLRIRFRGARRDTIFAGHRLARLIARMRRGTLRQLDFRLRRFRPGQLAAALRRLHRLASRPMIFNLAGRRFLIGGRRLPAIRIPYRARFGPVLRPARIAAWRLSRSAGGRSARFGYSDLRGAVLTLGFTNRSAMIFRGSGVGRFLCTALRRRSLTGISGYQLARGLQTAANWAGSARLQIMGQPPVRIIASALVLAYRRKERSRVKLPQEIIFRLRRFAGKFRYKKHVKRFLPGQLKGSGYMDCDDFALYAWNLFYKNGYTPSIYVILNPRKKSDPSGKKRDFHAICIYREGKVWHSVDFGPRFRSFRAGVPDPSLLPGMLYGRTVRYTTVNADYWRRGERDPDLNLLKTGGWLISIRP